MTFLRCFFAALGCLLAFCGPTTAVEIERITTNDQTRFLMLKGEFVFADDANDLVRQTMDFRPVFVSFASPGGNVDAAQRFGRMIRALRLPTVQLRATECASACTFAFVGGVVRLADAGSIGVHRASFSDPDQMGAHTAVAAIQAGTADTISYLTEMGVDPGLLQLSLSVDSSDMRYLTANEMRQYRVTTADDLSDVAGAASPTKPTSYAPASPGPTTPSSSPEPQRAAAIEIPDPSVSSASAVDAWSPNRVAIYNGLDFIGRDIGSTTVSDASSCAMQCLSSSGCKAFTFNTKTRASRGPNCFIKGSQGQMDGNSVAVSGLLLGRLDPDPQTLTFGAIDPNTHLYKDIDIPGFDLSRKPLANAQTQLDCRIACVNHNRCAAFTFVPKKKECWLKSGIGEVRTMPGMVSGAKSPMTYAPRSVSLE